MSATESLELLLAFLVGTVAVARATRLVVDDDFPPVRWLVDRWDVRTEGSSWNLLLHCPFCLATWFGLADVLWAYFSDLHVTWWLANVWFAGIYLAAMICVRDIPPEQRG